MPSDPFLDSRTPLVPTHGVAVMIVLEDGRYLLQHRDPLPRIFYPDHWGFFGGAVDDGEDDAPAACREIEEELGWKVGVDDLKYFTQFTFDFGCAGLSVMRRVYYELTGVSAAQAAAIKLGEGQSVEAFQPRDALDRLKITPYDAFALWLRASGCDRFIQGRT